MNSVQGSRLASTTARQVPQYEIDRRFTFDAPAVSKTLEREPECMDKAYPGCSPPALFFNTLERVPGQLSADPTRRFRWNIARHTLRKLQSGCGKRIRTAQLANREKRGLLPLRGLEPAVSGSDTSEPDCQNPAESRGFLRACPSARGKSLQRRTRWRCVQSIANSSLELNP